MTDSLAIAEYLTTRYDDEEVAARACIRGRYPTRGNPGRWNAHQGGGNGWFVGDDAAGEYSAAIGDPEDAGDSFYSRAAEAMANYIAYHDPARTLADIDAKRQLLTLWRRMEADVDSPGFHQAADELLAQLLAPYGKRAVFTRTGTSGPLSWHLEDDPAHGVED